MGFVHSAESHAHEKCALLIGEMGFEGYGKFWATLEYLWTLHNKTLDLTNDTHLNTLADKLHIARNELAVFLSALFRIGLLKKDGSLVWNRMQKGLYDKRCKRATEHAE